MVVSWVVIKMETATVLAVEAASAVSTWKRDRLITMKTPDLAGTIWVELMGLAVDLLAEEEGLHKTMQMKINTRIRTSERPLCPLSNPVTTTLLSRSMMLSSGVIQERALTSSTRTTSPR
jgi:hypothetical protein